jgi:Ca-activated chloride channel homolog
LKINRAVSRLVRIFCPLLLSLLLLSLQPATAQSRIPTMHIEVDLQPVEVQVKDSHGNDALGLSAKDFTVLENGRPQKIAFFDSGNGPVSLVVLVDSSNSMGSGGTLGSANAIAAQFMRIARPGDDISAMDFTDQLGPFEHLNDAQLQNQSTISLAPAPSRGSALYDAIASALCHLRSSKNPRQAVIVVSDGVDQYSRLTLEQLIDLVRSSRAQLFMIGLQSRSDFHFQGHAEPKLTLISGHDIDNPVVVFDRLMKESGAESFIPNSQRSLNESLTAVSNMLQSEYTLAYYPEKTARNGPRKIEVKVDRKGLRVFGNRVVTSTADAAQLVHFDEATCTISPSFYKFPYEAKLTNGPNGMIYREDFSNPHTGWPVHKDSHYVSGAYELDNLSTEVANNEEYTTSTGEMMDSPPETTTTRTFQQDIVAAYGPWWHDFRASVNLKAVFEKMHNEAKTKPSNEAHPAAGLLFRMNVNGYYALLVSGNTDKDKLSIELVRRDFLGGIFGASYSDSYTEVQLVPWTTVLQPSSGTELSVEAIGTEISVFVDGQEVKSVQDDSYDQGYVGFVISGPGRALFSNLLVQQK